jgi:hypothetical protein
MRSTSKGDGRYQNSPWWVRLWRCRWYLWTPIVALQLYYGKGEDPNIKLRWDFCWSLAKGLTHGKMQYVYTSEEVMDMLRERRDERQKARNDQ